MGQQEKLLEIFLSNPRDFTYDNLLKLLSFYGYEERTGGKTSGSSVKFVRPNGAMIFIHKPHPEKILKAYQIRQIIRILKENGDIDG